MRVSVDIDVVKFGPIVGGNVSAPFKIRLGADHVAQGSPGCYITHVPSDEPSRLVVFRLPLGRLSLESDKFELIQGNLVGNYGILGGVHDFVHNLVIYLT